MRKVDKLGRIVIPLELREKYGLTEGKEIEFLDIGDGVAVKPYDMFCKICHKKLANNATLPLCDNCIKDAAKHYIENNCVI